jgi:hypothetical protein
MDVLEFLQRSEWPLLIGGAFWYFRKPLYRLLDHIRPTKVSALGVSIDLALDRAETLTVETRALTEAESPNQPGTQRVGDELRLEEDNAKHPQLVVLMSWAELQDALYRAAAEPTTPRVPQWVTVRNIERIANELGLTRSEIEAIKELRKVRNRVADEIDFPLSRAEAVRFAELSRDLILRLQTLKPEFREKQVS